MLLLESLNSPKVQRNRAVKWPQHHLGTLGKFHAPLQWRLEKSLSPSLVKADVTPIQTESGERSALLDGRQLASLVDPAAARQFCA